MTAFFANSLSKQFPDGDSLFQCVTFSVPSGLCALVGRNGSGKTHLARQLAKIESPDAGSVDWGPGIRSVGFYSQTESIHDLSCSIASVLGIEDKLRALQHIAEGSTDAFWFDHISDSDWELESKTQQLMQELRLPGSVQRTLSELSGGQRAILRLYALLNQEHDAWILDEPTNHLDSEHVQWLIDRIRALNKPVLLVSHNIALLNQVGNIYELSSLGLSRYGGNYQAYICAKNERLQSLSKQEKSLLRERSVKTEKARQRQVTAQKLATRGQAARRSGSQPKIIVDGKKQAAQVANAAISAQSERQLTQLNQKITQVREQIEQNKPQRWYTSDAQNDGKARVQLRDYRNNRLGCKFLSAYVNTGQHVWIIGRNGTGKSTLLKQICSASKKVSADSERLIVNGRGYYLDQHFSALNPAHTVLEAVCKDCEGMLMPRARTLLAGIGFRTDTVHKRISTLSGGEKMKVAMLIASHQSAVGILLLDEPDNHLDLEAKGQLVDAINGYLGTVMIVSHDLGFIEELRIDHIIDVER
ncbi:ATP-binding cassette domain-containing protein [Vibrio parahaemolyticus]|uniref:ATP-binding cassette domain-containing protein n=1 Tax=Vibrio mediterranei TaxID=689 RepID=UPI00406951AC